MLNTDFTESLQVKPEAHPVRTAVALQMIGGLRPPRKS